MSKRLILRDLKKKNIIPVSVEYQRSCPTPSGYAKGWDIGFNSDLVDVIYRLDRNCEFTSLMELDDLSSVIDWIKGLPVVALDGVSDGVEA